MVFAAAACCWGSRLVAVIVLWPRIAVRARRAPSAPEAVGMQSALHAATSTLPHLRRGLHSRSAARGRARTCAR